MISPLVTFQNQKIRCLGEDVKSSCKASHHTSLLASSKGCLAFFQEQGEKRGFPLEKWFLENLYCLWREGGDLWRHQRRSDVCCGWSPAPWKHVNRGSRKYLEVRHPKGCALSAGPSKPPTLLHQDRCVCMLRGGTSPVEGAAWLLGAACCWRGEGMAVLWELNHGCQVPGQPSLR